MPTLRRLTTRSLMTCLLMAVAGPALAADVLIADSATGWKYLDNGSDQGTAWRAASFNDSAWATGTASLGYGDPATTTVASGKITYYFRRSFNVVNPAAYTSLTLRQNYDDGTVVYINGTEVQRASMPTGNITYTTTGTNHGSGTWETFSIPTGTLVAGNNVIAVEVHNQAASSSDIHFNLGLIGEDGLSVTRGPYLQSAGPDRMTLRWRTAAASTGRVRFGTTQGSLTQTVNETAAGTEHVVTLTGLLPNTRYYYAIADTGAGDLAGNDANHFFETSPANGADAPTRIWVLGDAGTANGNQTAVKNAYTARTAGAYTDLILMLGDNAYGSGTDSEYQNAVFNMYKDTLRQTPVWSTLGNHENDYGNRGNFFNIFSFPTQARTQGLSTGVDSGSEGYYSFDHGQVHFICLDSASSQDYSSAGAMYQWLQQDLQQNTGKWVVVFFHHPPYSKGSHDSDTNTRMAAMRQTFNPLMEQYGVDLVLGGHSHAYERSKFIDGHYDVSSTFNNALKSAGGHVVQAGSGAPGTPYTKTTTHTPHDGTVYCVAGSAGQTSGGTLNHAAMYLSLNTLGSLVLTVSGDTLQADFVDSTNTIRDTYQVRKQGAPPVNTAPVANADAYTLNANTTLTVATPGVLTNDTDAESNPLSAVLVANAAHGTVSLATNGSFTYTPVANYTGPDSFTYKANDGSLDSAVATVNLTINAAAGNTAPVANTDSWFAYAGTQLVVSPAGVLLNDTDAESNPLTAALVSGSANGSVSLAANGGFTFTPSGAFIGPTSFTYKANDGLLDSATATANIQVLPGTETGLVLWYKLDETAGTTAADSSGSGYTGSLAGNTAFAAGRYNNGVYVDGAGDAVTGPTLNLNSNTVTLSGWVKRNGAQNDWDGLFFCRGGTTTAGLSIMASGQLRYHWNNGQYGFVSNLVVPDNTWTFVALVVEPTKATVYMMPAGGSMSSAANTVAHAAEEFNAALLLGRDSQSGRDFNGWIDNVRVYNRSLTATEIANLANPAPPPANTAPVANADSYSTPKSVTLSVAAPGVLTNDTDAESNPLTAALVTQAANGTVTLNANGSFTYVPAAGYSGSDSFTYRANDGSLNSTTTVNLAVMAPTLASAKTTYLTTEAMAFNFANAPGNKLDWIGLYPQGVTPGTQSAKAWYYTDGTRTGTAGRYSGTVNFNAGTLPAGNYTAYLCLNDGYTVAASVNFTVSP